MLIKKIVIIVLLNLFPLSIYSDFVLSPDYINEWQFLDKNGLVYPWYTKPFLDILSTWDVSNWEVLEWGGGYSTVWWASHCKSVTTIDHDAMWTSSIQTYLNKLGLKNVIIKVHPIMHAIGIPIGIANGGENSSYVTTIDEDHKLYDCIIIDGVFRNDCAVKALRHIKPNGIIILDDANRASIGFNSQQTFSLLAQYEHYSYLQPGHPDWRTDVWIINKI